MEIKIEDYEKYLKRLNDIVSKMEDSETSLAESIKLYTEASQIHESLTKLLEEEKSRLKIFKDGDFVDGSYQDL